MTRVIGCHLTSSGSSTGTGAMQTIAHGLGAVPSVVVVYAPTTGELLGAVADATNIYPTMALNLAYNWRCDIW